jgi:hypothetical protein
MVPSNLVVALVVPLLDGVVGDGVDGLLPLPQFAASIAATASAAGVRCLRMVLTSRLRWILHARAREKRKQGISGNEGSRFGVGGITFR